MKLYLISQDENDNYDTYDSAVVAARTQKGARSIHPGYDKWPEKNNYVWCSSPEMVKVEYLGEAKKGTKEGRICSSFNAG